MKSKILKYVRPDKKIDKMKRHRAMYQMKEQDNPPEKQLNEVEIVNLPEKEFRIMIVKIQDLRKRMEAKMEKMQEMSNKDQEELKNKQIEMNNTITEKKNNVLGMKAKAWKRRENKKDSQGYKYIR